MFTCTRGYKGPNTSKKHPPAPDLSLSAPDAANYPPEPCLVQRHHLSTPSRQIALQSPAGQWVRRGFLYLVAIMDWATRKGLSWQLSNTLDASFYPLGRLLRNRLTAMAEALKEAIAKYGKPEIMNAESHIMVTSSRVV